MPCEVGITEDQARKLQTFDPSRRMEKSVAPQRCLPGSKGAKGREHKTASSCRRVGGLARVSTGAQGSMGVKSPLTRNFQGSRRSHAFPSPTSAPWAPAVTAKLAQRSEFEAPRQHCPEHAGRWHKHCASNVDLTKWPKDSQFLVRRGRPEDSVAKRSRSA